MCWAPSGRKLVQRIGDAPDWPARFALIDAAIRARLADAAPVDAGVEWSLRRITASGGTTMISDLAGELGWSHRRLIARYRDVVGLPPSGRADRALRATRSAGGG